MDKLNLFNLSGKNAIVTGGAQGLGYAVAKYLSLYGAEVCIIDISKDLETSVKNLADETGGTFHAVYADLSIHETRAQVFKDALEKLNGRLDILVNCAGIIFACESIDFPYDRYKKILDVNLDAVFELCQMAARVMIPQGKGNIVNFASVASFVGGWHTPAYTASKGAVMQLTKTLSNEWSGLGIRVNAVAPGYIDTPLNAKFFADPDSQRVFRRIAMKRWGKPEDIASAVLFMVSDAAEYMTGVTLPIDGGVLANE